ncbi:MAG: glycine--tRNA ligase subunit beta [Anaerolineae bacterium]|nr:glycine--tRNA ligase subunit beta [Anaerolineae bacterium]
MNKPLNFQSMILALHHYWDQQGCLIWHPYYSQLGAGTNNPATFLRVLGPEPFSVAYVEPSVRPDDGRYGNNPNRLQMFYQYQVILKPDPGNPQELYLKSLQAIGIDPQEHDIRFVEDNWESPALGAWGLGWEVWLDGLEITQFTYFQQAGQQDLDPVSVEITYGLDRIAAPLQGVTSFKDIQWSDKFTFGDMNLMNEREQSKYYFEVADVDRWRKIYELTEAEVEAAHEQGLVLPAYDNLLKLSHIFNILDTRGAIGVTERQQFFRRMRKQAGQVASLYVEQRQQMEYPWLDAGASLPGEERAAAGKAGNSIKIEPLKKAADFLLEIGTEELPPADLDTYQDQLAASVPTMLDGLYLNYDSVKVMGTPRRLVVSVKNLAPQQPDREELVKGPPAERAFGADGKPTKAAEGFARGKGVDVKDLQTREIDGGEYVVVEVKMKGRPAGEVLAEKLPELIANLKVNRTMRWNSSNIAFSRPIRWLLALHGSQVIPFEYGGYQAAGESRGLRFSASEVFSAANPEEYYKTLKDQGILLDAEERRSAIETQVKQLAKQVGGEIKEDPALLSEVTHLVEAPAALRGEFDKSHLSLPREVLVSVMKKHQRYFPVYKGEELLPYFITVRNGDGQHSDIVAAGNEAVVRARFADAEFFVSEDTKKPLAAYLPDLDTLTFQAKLGSMLDKTNRIASLVETVARQISLTEQETKTAVQAAKLCKADLATSMVVEMTSLQGIIGQQYAQRAGEPQAVSLAIAEHYLPRYSGDAVPSEKPGLAVGLADRLDTLAGLFSAGLAPTGAKDPFAQRRAALGLVQNLISWDLDFDLRAGLEAAAAQLPVEHDGKILAECLEFILERQRNLLLEEGLKYDIVDAVLASQGHNPAGAKRAAAQLSEWTGRKDWDEILPAYSRCVRITRDLEEVFPVDPKALREPAEKALFAALEKAEQTGRRPGSVDDFLNAFLPVMPAINEFFDGVLVMDEDDAVRRNRLGLLQRIAALAEGAADMSRLEGF